MFLSKSIMALAATTFLALPAVADSIMVMDPYARSASPAAKSGAAFMVLHNMSEQDDRLIAARSEAAQRVELHTHKETGDGIMQMVEVEEGFPVAAGEKISLERGGAHVMLMGLTGPLEQDAEIEVTLVFEEAGELVVTIPVDNERAPQPGAHGHDHGAMSN